MRMHILLRLKFVDAGFTASTSAFVASGTAVPSSFRISTSRPRPGGHRRR